MVLSVDDLAVAVAAAAVVAGWLDLVVHAELLAFVISVPAIQPEKKCVHSKGDVQIMLWNYLPIAMRNFNSN